MAKEAYYFSHDSNARHDPKITAMRSVYGTEGYGWFWILIELMREANGYKLDMQGKYTFNAYAMQMHTDSTTAEQFIRDCVNEFELFDSDDTHFWSPSLLRRMELREEISEKKRQAALKRWGKQKKDTDGMHMHNKSNTNGMQGKESKLNKSKGNEIEKKEKEDALSSLSNPNLDHIINLCKECEITDGNLFTFEQMASYVGMVDIEVVEAAIKKSSGKSMNYALGTLKGMVERDGITKKEQLHQPKVSKFPRKESGKPKIQIADVPEEPLSDEEYERLVSEVRAIEQKMKGVG